MPRQMPRFDRALSAQAQTAIAIVRAGETTRISGGSIGRAQWSRVRLEALYELAYLRVFSAWENCLESIFFRSLCGYASSAGQETLVVGQHYRNLATAEGTVLGNASFLLWHNPTKVINRCRQHIRSGVPGCPGLQETVISSNVTRLEQLASIRHRIVHDQDDAKQKFDLASLSIAGRIYLASRPGKFLRDWDNSSPPRRWLDVTIGELVGIAGQMV
jgi:hypothetical protein